MYIFIYVKIIYFIYQTLYFFFRRRVYNCSSVCTGYSMSACRMWYCRGKLNWMQRLQAKISILTQSFYS